MTEPIVIVIGTTPAVILTVVCIILVTVLAVRDYRNRKRTLQAIRDMTIPPATWKDY